MHQQNFSTSKNFSPNIILTKTFTLQAIFSTTLYPFLTSNFLFGQQIPITFFAVLLNIFKWSQLIIKINIAIKLLFFHQTLKKILLNHLQHWYNIFSSTLKQQIFINQHISFFFFQLTDLSTNDFITSGPFPSHTDTFSDHLLNHKKDDQY